MDVLDLGGHSKDEKCVTDINAVNGEWMMMSQT